MISFEYLKILNPWWFGERGIAEFLRSKRNSDLQSLYELIEKRNPVIISGLRGTGKSFLIYQLIEHLMKKKADPRNIIVLDYLHQSDPLNDILNYIGDELFINNQDFFNTDKYIFIFNPEFRKNLFMEIKDISKKKPNFKFIISTSCNPDYILKISGIKDIEFSCFKLYPIDFISRLNIRQINFKKLSFPLKEILNFELFKKQEKNIIKNNERMRTLIAEFLEGSGVLGYYDLKDPIRIIHELRIKIIERIIYRDMHRLFEVKHLSLMENIFNFLCENSSSISNLLQISKKFCVSYPSLLKYLKFLKVTYLISDSRNYYIGSKNEKRTNRKFYLTDTGFIPFMALQTHNRIKTALFNHCKRISERNNWDVFFWQHHRSEIELLIEMGDTLIPIDTAKSFSIVKKEVDADKIKRENAEEKITENDFKGIKKFLEKNKYERGILITNNSFGIKKYKEFEIMYMPLWLFLLSS